METQELTIRLAEGDAAACEAVGDLHAELYAAEFGFGAEFSRHVYEGLRELAADPAAGRLWVVETAAGIRGAIGVTAASPSRARLRWFLLDPALRGRGLGRELIRHALGYARERGFGSIYLTTIPQLTTAAALYREAGFVKIRERPGAPWGGPGTEQIYALDLTR